MVQINPFIIEGYKSPDYFCDRALDTKLLEEHLQNQRNVALISKRRLGKSGLIHNLFYQSGIKNDYYTFYVDIYDTKNLAEFTYELGKCILNGLKPLTRKIWESFVSMLKALKIGVSFDIDGTPEWEVSIGDIQSPDVLLDEIIKYLEQADKRCIVAIDEFQVIANYPEKTVEATLRKRIQNCKNVNFIYSGSKRHMMSEMFLSHGRPFYNSSAMMGLEAIDRSIYLEFVNQHLAPNKQCISKEAFDYLYDWCDGTTWYVQNVMNTLYVCKGDDICFGKEDVDNAINTIVQRNTFAYKAMLFQLAPKQKQVLYAIANEGKAEKITSQRFLRKYSLTSSSVQGAIKVLLDHDIVTFDEGIYELCDKFFETYIVLTHRR